MCACLEYIGGLEAEGSVNPNQADFPTEHTSYRILRLEIEVEVGMKELLAMHSFCATVVENLGEEMIKETSDTD